MLEHTFLQAISQLAVHESLDFATRQHQRTILARTAEELCAKIQRAHGWTLVRVTHPTVHQYIAHLSRPSDE